MLEAFVPPNLWSCLEFGSFPEPVRRETGPVPAVGWTGDDGQWCNRTLCCCLPSGQLSHSPSSARAVLRLTKQQHGVDFKAESL